MKTSVLLTALLLASRAWALNCDVAAVKSTDSKTNATYRGNAFAYTSRHLVVNDHTLAPDADFVSLGGSLKGRARVVQRDFHTDLAVLEIESGSLKPCQLKRASNQSFEVIGYDGRDQEKSRLPVQLKTSASKKLMVPGVPEALEVFGSAELRASQSGSVLVQNGAVTGLITQKTSEGTALAIPAEVVDQISRAAVQGKLPKRRYEVDRRQQIFKFDGLKINPKSQPERRSGVGGVDPHSSKIDPHSSRQGRNFFTNDPSAPNPIALEDYEIGVPLASVEDFSILAESQPALAQALRAARVQRVFISSIDGREIRTSLDLLRVLGDCSRCAIDDFWIEVQKPEEVQNSTLRVMGWIAALVIELEKSNQTPAVRKAVTSLQTVNPLLARMVLESDSGRVNLALKEALNMQWQKIEREIAPIWLSERSLDILNEIRKEMN